MMLMGAPVALPSTSGRGLGSCTAPRITSQVSSRQALRVTAVMAPAQPTTRKQRPPSEVDLSAAPPFTLADLKNAIPSRLFEKKAGHSMAFLARDVAIVIGLAAAAQSINSWWVWPAYWLAQGTMFWALFVVGHDCGHGSFSSNKQLNDLVGNITHSSILVPYHGWRISHRTHHANHGHVERDESWYPTTESQFKSMDAASLMGRCSLPISLFAYPFYLFSRSPGKTGSHFDPNCDLFSKSEQKLIRQSNMYNAAFLAVLAACTAALGPMAMLKLYVVPYWINVMWLDVVTYLHHHGPSTDDKIPWYRGEEWSYLRGGLSTIDRDYGIFNKVHHDIGTHVVHHLLPQIPHYNLTEATEACKPVLGPYYREPEKSKGWIPFHLIKPLIRSFGQDHYVSDSGNIVYYQKDPEFWSRVLKSWTGKA